MLNMCGGVHVVNMLLLFPDVYVIDEMVIC